MSARELVGRVLGTRGGIRAQAAREVAAAQKRGDHVTAMRIQLAQDAAGAGERP